MIGPAPHDHSRFILPTEFVRAAADGTSWVRNVVKPVLRGAELLQHAELFQDEEGWKAEVYFAASRDPLVPTAAVVRLRRAESVTDPQVVEVMRREPLLRRRA